MTATFGDVTGEYLALRTEAGYIAGLHEIVWVEGADAVSFLDGLLSQSIESMPVGAAAPSLLLGPRGKLRATLWVLRGDALVGLVANVGRAAVVAEDLTRFRLRVDAGLRREARSVIDVWGPEAHEALTRAGLGAPEDAGWVDADGALVASLPFMRASLPRYVVAGAGGDRLRAAGIRECGLQAATSVRIEAGEPAMGEDLDESTIPQEAGLVEATVDLDKGCFLGQELVARIDSRGRVNRHLRGLLVTTNVLPPPGADVVLEDRSIGIVTSVGESLELRAPVALALIRREASPGDVVEIRWKDGGVGAVVEELPLDPSL